MNSQTHWDKVYTEKAPDAVSWYRPHLEKSLALIQQVAPHRSASIIDGGGGEPTLVDDLLAAGTKMSPSSISRKRPSTPIKKG